MHILKQTSTTVCARVIFILRQLISHLFCVEAPAYSRGVVFLQQFTHHMQKQHNLKTRKTDAKLNTKPFKKSSL